MNCFWNQCHFLSEWCSGSSHNNESVYINKPDQYSRVVLIFAEEEAAEVKKSKLYQPATKFVHVSQHVSPSAESKKSVSLFIFLFWIKCIISD